jgi:hypothetical protein
VSSSGVYEIAERAVEKTSDMADAAELTEERDLAIWNLDKCFAQLDFRSVCNRI